MIDNFKDATGDGVTAEVIDDGQFVIVNIFSAPGSEGSDLGIALTADQAREAAHALLTLADGL